MDNFYKDGDEVELTEWGKRQVGGCKGKRWGVAHTGVVVGDQFGDKIKVRKHGRKSIETYSIVYWVHV